jgi:hypothetical protein
VLENSKKLGEMKSYSSNSSMVKIMWAGGAMSGLLALCSLFACGPTLTPRAVDLSGSISSSQIQSLLTTSDAGVVAYWKMEETAADTVAGGFDFADSSGSNNNLKIQSGTCVFAQPGIDSYAVQTTTLGYASTTAPIMTVTDGMSFGAWVKWNGTTPGSAIPFLMNGNGTTNGYGFILHNGTTSAAGNKVGLYLPGVGYNEITSATAPALTSGTWTNLFITRSNSTWTLYVNGVAYGTGTADPMTPTTGTGIGGFPGLVDDVTYWNSALSADEIMTLYEVQSGSY